MERSPPSALLSPPALRFALSSPASGAALPVKCCLCFWLCSPCPQASLPISPRTLTSGPLCAGTPSHPLPPQRGQGSWPLSPVEGGGHQVVLLGAGRGLPCQFCISSPPIPMWVAEVGAGVLHSWGEHGVQGGLAQPHSRSPLCAPCLVTRAKEKFLENYNFVS